MKFLCVRYNVQMKLSATQSHEEIGSLSVVYRCPDCAQETAMLTNPGETQMVQSLGIKVGPAEESSGASKCPFSAMLGQDSTVEETAPPTGDPLWAPEAQQRLERIPEFVRPMAKMGIEKFASERGYPQITVAVLNEAREQFGF